MIILYSQIDRKHHFIINIKLSKIASTSCDVVNYFNLTGHYWMSLCCIRHNATNNSTDDLYSAVAWPKSMQKQRHFTYTVN